MSRKRKKQIRSDTTPASKVAYLLSDEAYQTLCISGYTSLDKCPEIMTACRRVAEIIGSMTIYIMSNTDRGDIRIVNELSRAIDIEPMPTMTRQAWMEAIVMNLLLYGGGNSIVVPHTYRGYLQSLEPIAAYRVSFVPDSGSYRDYTVLIDGKAHRPDSVLHFVHNPDEVYLWKGRGMQVSLRDLAHNLRQAAETERGFMASKWKPSIIVKVDGLTDDFASPEGRRKLLQQYIESAEAGEPWMIPSEQFSVEQVRPLSLADLAINDTVQLDKRMVAAIIGVPPFLLGVGDYSQDAWNSFIQTTVRTIVTGIQQEMTRKLIISPNWYVKFNTLSLMDWDLNTLYTVFAGLADKGIVTGNEVRDRIGMAPLDGLDELRILENYIPADRIGDQAKLNGGN